MDSFPKLEEPDPEPVEETKAEEPTIFITKTEAGPVVEPVPELKEVAELINEEPYQDREPPKKKKREISQKQKDHLARARIASVAKKRAKTEAKEALEREVRREMAKRMPTPSASPPAPIEPTPPQQSDGFESFLNNMSQFKEYEMRFNIEREKEKIKETTTKNKVAKILTPPPKPVAPSIIATPLKNEYADAFSW